MSDRSAWVRAAILSLAAVAVAGIPYGLAWHLAPDGTRFAGFLLNPIDGFSYLAKMRQGADGAWSFRLPYAADPGEGVLLFVYPLLLGHLSRWLGGALLPTYHAARLLAAWAMYVAAFAFLRQSVGLRRARWLAFAMILIGSGQGWIAAIGWGQTASDLWIAESVPFLSAYANAHFPLAGAAFLGLMTLLAGSESDRSGARLLAMAGGFILGAVQPFVIVTLLTVCGGWLAWEWLRVFRRGERGLARSMRNTAWLGGLTCLGAAPWMAYDYWISRVHPAISAWNAQNLTLSPPPREYLFGFGLLIPLALAGALRPDVNRRPQGRLLIAWAVAGLLLLYAPFPFQRRLSFMLYVPLAALSAMALHHTLNESRPFRLASMALLILCLPSQALVMAAGLGGVRNGDPALVHLAGEVEAFEWIRKHASPGDMVLASPEIGNRLPAFADVRVLYGHPFETPEAESWRARVEALFSWEGDQEQALEDMRGTQIRWVFYGARERALGAPTWLPSLAEAARFGDTVIYRLAEP